MISMISTADKLRSQVDASTGSSDTETSQKSPSPWWGSLPLASLASLGGDLRHYMESSRDMR